MKSKNKVSLLKVLAFPASAAFMMGVGVTAIHADETQPPVESDNDSGVAQVLLSETQDNGTQTTTSTPTDDQTSVVAATPQGEQTETVGTVEEDKEETNEEPVQAKEETSSASEDSNSSDKSTVAADDASDTNDSTYISDMNVTSNTDEVSGKGATIQFTSHVYVNGETTETSNTKYNGVTWSIVDSEEFKKYVTITQEGLLTVVEGVDDLTYITVRATSTYNSEEYYDYYIRIKAVEAKSVTISGYTADYMVKNQTVQLTTTVSPSDTVDKNITWSSSDASVATVDSNGKVTAIGQGTVKIIATAANGAVAELSITVYDQIPQSETIQIWVTNQKQGQYVSINVPTDGSAIPVDSFLPTSTEFGGKQYAYTGTMRYLTQTLYNANPSDWSQIQQCPLVEYLKIEKGQLKYSSDGTSWSNVTNKTYLAAFYGLEYEGDSSSNTGVKVIVGDWPYGANESTSNTKQTITVNVINRETNKTVYTSGTMRYDNNSNGNYGKLQFNCDDSLYDIDYVVVTKSGTQVARYDGSSLPAEGISVAFTKGGTNAYTVTAYLKAKTFSVVYDGNGTEDNVPTDSNVYKPAKDDENTVTVSSQVPTREGYIFAGWTYNNTLYQGGETIKVTTVPKDGVLTLTASWIPVSSLVRYEAQTVDGDTNGGWVTRTQERVSDQTKTLKGSEALANTGYDFIGWYLGDELVSKDAKFTPSDIDAAKGKTYVAKFKKQEFTIKSEVVNGTITANQTVKYDGSATFNYSANTGYKLSKVEVDGEDVTADYPSSYTFNSVKANHTIKVTYVRDTESFKVTGYEGTYDGSSHSVTTAGDLITGEDWQYSTDNENWSTTLPTYTDAGTYTVYVKVVNGSENVWSGQADVKINKRDVTITSGSAEKVYDGTALTKEEVTVSGDGFVDGEGADYSYTGTQTIVGSSENGFSYTLKDGTKAANYNITTANGTLTVTADEKEVVVTIKENSETVKYDGISHTLKGYTIESISNKLYSEDDFEFSGTDAVTGTDAGTYDLKITSENFKNTNNNFTKVTFVVLDGSLTIQQREVTISSASAQQVYNGKALKTDIITVTGDGFVGEEGATYNVTGSQTNAGDSKNTFTYTLNDNTKEANYKITKSEGTLLVTPVTDKVTVTIVGNTGSNVYSGTNQSVTGYTVKTSNTLYTENSFSYSGTKTATGKDVGTYAMGLQSSDFTNTDETNFSNVEFVVTDGKLEITPATLTITTPSDSKVYDGQPLTKEGTISGFVNGETATFTTTGTITNVGEKDNTYILEWNETTKASNYKIDESIGKLTVTEQSIVPGDKDNLGITINSPSDSVYDGQEHKWSPVVKDKDGKVLVEGTDYKVTYDKTDYTNVTGDIKVTITGIGNYKGEVTKSYKITPVALTVVTNTDSKVYDGTALIAPSGTITGLVNGETATVVATGSQTDVGNSKNTFGSISWGTAKESNYTYTVTLGTLTVTEQSINPDDPSYKGIEIDSPSDKEYDGQEHKWSPTVTSGEKILVEGTDYTVTYDKTDYTNVTGDIKVTITGIGNYKGEVTKSYQITPKEITVTTDSASKVYDGTELTAPSGTISGLVEGETATVVATGSQTNVGSSKNTYDGIMWADGKAKSSENTALSTNYKVTTVTEGTLTVTPQSIDPEDPTEPDPKNPDQPVYKGVTINSPENKVYDGQDHKWSPTVTDKDGKVLVEGTDYTVTYKEGQDFKNVTGKIVVTITGIGNYSGTVTRTYEITKRPLKVVTDSATKEYDGKALTAGGTVIGYVDGELVIIQLTGSQTEVGSSKNTYKLVFGDNALEGNYEIVEEEIGTLTVTKKAEEPKEEPSEPTVVQQPAPVQEQQQVGVQTGVDTNMTYLSSAAGISLVGAILLRRRKDKADK